MPIIKTASIQNLKARADIVEVVSSVVTLRRAGSKFKGLSPFNAERTPSFFVDPDKGFYKCFSSGKAGDVISFVMETERLDFTEAVETLARRFNVPLEYEAGGGSREERSLRQELFDLHEEATAIYREAFGRPDQAGRFARDYWARDRRFAPEVAEDFSIGLAPPDGGPLLERLRRRSFSDHALRQCGLFYVRAGGTLAPRFRGRLMIPIRDHQGRVVAFTARQLEITPADDPTREAKYVNSPETPVFTKGQILFNLDRARRHAGEGKPFLMVEGQLDAIRCWTAGLLTTIAPQGTGVTDTQMRLLRRYHAGLECLLDGDTAGQQAALRLLPLALDEGLEIGFLPLAEKTDPDALIREKGVEAIAELRQRRLGAMAFAVGALMPRPETLSAQQRADACTALFDILRHARSEVAQAEYLAEMATLTGLSRGALEADYRRHREAAARRSANRPAPSPTDEGPPPEGDPGSVAAPARTASAEEELLLLLLHFESLGPQIAQAIDHHWINNTTRAGRLLDQFLNDFAHDLWPGVESLDEHVEKPADRDFLASLLFDQPAIEDPVRVANDGIRRIVSDFCGAKKEKIDLEIAAKQGNFDADLISLLRTSEELCRLKLNPPTIRKPA